MENSSTNCSQEDTAHLVHATPFLVALGSLYTIVFVVAVFGNILVVYVVATNREMQTVTNIFITNLAVSDLLVNFSALWLTPLYVYLSRWIFGEVMCHLFPLLQGTTTFNSALTLMAIALDRYVVILYPFKPRISKKVCLTVAISIWLLSALLVCPYSVNMSFRVRCGLPLCLEKWTWNPMKKVYGFMVMVLQFGIPGLVMAICYVRIWWHITRRHSTAVTSNVDADAARKRRLLKMLVSMVVIFELCWLPVNCLNIIRDLGLHMSFDTQFSTYFLFAHVISMSATCWNPILYAWMNENFQREFQAVLPCFPGTRLRLYRAFSASHGRLMAANGGSFSIAPHQPSGSSAGGRSSRLGSDFSQMFKWGERRNREKSLQLEVFSARDESNGSIPGSLDRLDRRRRSTRSEEIKQLLPAASPKQIRFGAETATRI